MSGRRLSDDEHALWSGVTRSVAPLPRRKPRAEPITVAASAGLLAPPAKPRPRPAQATPRTLAPPPAPLPPPAALGRRFKREVTRGKRAIEARLDLHGLTQTQAHHALLSFLRGAQARGSRLVLVITGKGAPGDDPLSERGVLRRQVPRWLRTAEFRAHVAGFEAAAIGHGGEGALYVSLRRTRV
jgi:DNA-nicking Smr family endonuclease